MPWYYGVIRGKKFEKKNDPTIHGACYELANGFSYSIDTLFFLSSLFNSYFTSIFVQFFTPLNVIFINV